MPNPKRVIPVSEVRPGDSIQLPEGPVMFVVLAGDSSVGTTVLTGTIDRGPVYQHVGPNSETVVVGFTNRAAKRARGKMARRARLGATR